MAEIPPLDEKLRFIEKVIRSEFDAAHLTLPRGRFSVSQRTFDPKILDSGASHRITGARMANGAPTSIRRAHLDSDANGSVQRLILIFPPSKGLGPGRLTGLVEIIQNGVGGALFVYKPVGPRMTLGLRSEDEAEGRGTTHCGRVGSRPITMARRPGRKLSHSRQLIGLVIACGIKTNRRGCCADTKTAA